MMKKKYRRAVCDVLLRGIIIPLYRLFYYPAIWLWKLTNWTKTKMRVWDEDND